MDLFEDPLDVLPLASIMLLMLLNTHRALLESCSSAVEEDSANIEELADTQSWELSSMELDAASRATLNHFRLWSTLAVVDEDLGFWVKPRSTTWFSRFLVHKYDDKRWVEMFRLTKRSVFTLTQLLSPIVKKRDTKYRLAVPVTVRIACTLFKLSHGASLLICSELFAVGRSTVSIILRQVVHTINIALWNEIQWPFGEHVVTVAQGFQSVCGLPGVAGAIDGIQIAIGKPRSGAADYFYFKSGGYSINCQAAVDSSRRFLDLYVGMPGSTNDSRMLRRSTLFHRGQRRSLWEGAHCFSGFLPYLVGDAGYPLLPWLMVSHRRVGNLAVADHLFNCKLSKGRVVVENTFALLKLTFRELQQRIDLHVAFVPDVVTCCAILHNVLMNQGQDELDCLFQVLGSEDQHSVLDEMPAAGEENFEPAGALADAVERQGKRRKLGVFLSLQRLPAT